MKKIRHNTIVRLVSQLSGLSQHECRTVIEDYVTVLKDCVFAGNDVPIPTLGVVGLKYRDAKEAQLKPDIMKNGEMSWTEPKLEYNAPIFRFSKLFRAELRELTEGNVVREKPISLSDIENDEIEDMEEVDDMEQSEDFDNED